MAIKINKQSYTVPCSTKFRDVVIALAEKKSVNVADLARSILLILPQDIIETFADPGEPQLADREKIILKSGLSKGRLWRRKPRLQVRLTPGYKISFVRRALNLAVVLDSEHYLINVQKREVDALQNDKSTNQNGTVFSQSITNNNQQVSNVTDQKVSYEGKRLQELISALSFTPLPGRLSSRTDALHILGFFPTERPDRRVVRSKFKMLAKIHHPDNNYGNHQRMSQLNAAMDLLDA
jgi:hypothetical protein